MTEYNIIEKKKTTGFAGNVGQYIGQRSKSSD